MVRVVVDIPSEILEVLDRMMQERLVTRSELITEILEDALEKMGEKI